MRLHQIDRALGAHDCDWNTGKTGTRADVYNVERMLRKRLGKGATLVKEREGRGAPGVAPVEQKSEAAVPETEQIAG